MQGIRLLRSPDWQTPFLLHRLAIGLLDLRSRVHWFRQLYQGPFPKPTRTRQAVLPDARATIRQPFPQ